MHLSVTVTVMEIRIVRMAMHHRRVPVPVGVRLAGWCIRSMPMLVVRVVHVAVLVLHYLMRVLVVVALGEVQPQAERHQPARDRAASPTAARPA